jgi:HSP20 family protein
MACNPLQLMRELAVMQERMNRAWSAVQDRRADHVGDRGTWTPAVDIYRVGDAEVVLKAELPGLRREDIDIAVEASTLTIRGQRRREDGVADEAYHRVERQYGAFSRSFTLPADVETGAVRADYRDGVLTVRLPRRAEARQRQIQVAIS